MNHTRAVAEPNVTPLLDVLLVLLIVAMLALTVQRMIAVQLPEQRTDGPNTPSIVLEVLPGGGYAINREPVRPADLAARLRAIYAGRPDKIILVRGDPSVTYQEVIHAIDVARGAGVAVIGVSPGR